VVSDEDGAVPPRGWEVPRAEEQSPSDADSLAQLIEQLLAMVPDDLRSRLMEAARQLLEALRALIDWCVTRLECGCARGGGRGEVEVRDIPIL
jgi:hypothetical protein